MIDKPTILSPTEIRFERLLPGPEQPLPRVIAPPTDPNAPLPTQDVGLAPEPKAIPSLPGSAGGLPVVDAASATGE